MSEQIEIHLSLKNIEELFSEPAADPFDKDSRYISGIDEITGQLRLRRNDLNSKSCVYIRLIQEDLSSTAQSLFKEALHRYCAAKIVENQQSINEIRVNNRPLAISSFLIAAGLFLLTLLLIRFVPGLQAISGAIAGFVGIAIWVIFWEPIYNSIYAWRPNRLEIKVFENLRSADLLIEKA